MPASATNATKFHRYVAIGDSQTEGLHDYDEHGAPPRMGGPLCASSFEIQPGSALRKPRRTRKANLRSSPATNSRLQFLLTPIS